jgi:hypothetical protein
MRYTRALSWLLTDCEHICDVAVLGTGHDLPWRAARRLYESQIDFLYLDDAALANAVVRGDRLICGAQSYRAVIRDGDVVLSRRALARLADFTAAGGVLIDADAVADLPAAVNAIGQPDLHADPPAPDLRLMHVRKAGLDTYLLVNEGELTIETTVTPALSGDAILIDPLRGVVTSANAAGASKSIPLTLDRRESRLLVVDPGVSLPTSSATAQFAPTAAQPLLHWTVADGEGAPSPAPPLGDWASIPDLERFSGTLTYTTSFALATLPSVVELDLGRVGDAADVFVNGQPAGFAMWAPYRLTLDPTHFRSGENTIAVRVTNSAANYFDGALLPSGLIGAVALRLG